MLPMQRNLFVRVRAGYGLLLVILALVLTTTLLVRLANKALQLHTTSLEAQSALQLKWGAVTCERIALQRAEPFFEEWDRRRQENASTTDSPAAVRQLVQLGDCNFEMLISDEDAKASVSLLGGPGIRELVSPKYVPFLRIIPGTSEERGITGWGQVFELERFAQQQGTLRGLSEATAQISIWGSGVLNIHRAPGPVLQSVAATIVPEGRADRLVKTLAESPRSNTETLLRRTIKNDQEFAKLKAILGDGSRTYSVWTEAISKKGRIQLTHRVRMVDDKGLVRSFRQIIQ